MLVLHKCIDRHVWNRVCVAFTIPEPSQAKPIYSIAANRNILSSYIDKSDIGATQIQLNVVSGPGFFAFNSFRSLSPALLLSVSVSISIHLRFPLKFSSFYRREWSKSPSGGLVHIFTECNALGCANKEVQSTEGDKQNRSELCKRFIGFDKAFLMPCH